MVRQRKQMRWESYFEIEGDQLNLTKLFCYAVSDAVWAETTKFGLSETMRIVADAEDAKLPVRSIMKEKFGLKLQE